MHTLRELALKDSRLIPLFNNAGAPIGTPLTLLWAKWNRGEIPDEPGTYSGLNLSSDPVFVHTADQKYELVEFIAEVDVVRKL